MPSAAPHCREPGADAANDVDKNYYVYVAAESGDTVHLVRFGPHGGEVVRTIEVGAFATETEGPHGIKVSPDGRHWYVTIAHGQPYGSVFKYDTSDNISVGDVKVGLVSGHDGHLEHDGPHVRRKLQSAR